MLVSTNPQEEQPDKAKCCVALSTKPRGLLFFSLTTSTFRKFRLVGEVAHYEVFPCFSSRANETFMRIFHFCNCKCDIISMRSTFKLTDQCDLHSVDTSSADPSSFGDTKTVGQGVHLCTMAGLSVQWCHARLTPVPSSLFFGSLKRFGGPIIATFASIYMRNGYTDSCVALSNLNALSTDVIR